MKGFKSESSCTMLASSAPFFCFSFPNQKSEAKWPHLSQLKHWIFLLSWNFFLFWNFLDLYPPLKGVDLSSNIFFFFFLSGVASFDIFLFFSSIHQNLPFLNEQSRPVQNLYLSLFYSVLVIWLQRKSYIFNVSISLVSSIVIIIISYLGVILRSTFFTFIFSVNISP